MLVTDLMLLLNAINTRVTYLCKNITQTQGINYTSAQHGRCVRNDQLLFTFYALIFGISEYFHKVKLNPFLC